MKSLRKMKKVRQYHNTYFRQFLAMTGLSIAVMLMLTGCGGQDGQSRQSGESIGRGGQIVAPENPVQYVASFTDLDIPADAYFISNQWPVVYGMTTDPETGDAHFFRKNLDSDESAAEFIPSIKDFRAARKEIIRFSSDEAGNLYIIWYTEGEERDTYYFLCKYDGDGQEMMQKEITESEVCAEVRRINNIVADDEGRIYLFGPSHIFLYDQDWEYQGEVTGLEGNTGMVNICASGKGRDGNAYFTRWLSVASSGEWELAEVDFEGKKTGTVYKGFPEIIEGKSNFYLVPGVKYDFLVSDGEYLYGYRMEGQVTERILKWADVDISGSRVVHFCELENMDILVIERMTGLQMVRLSEQDEMTVEKEIITLGVTTDNTMTEDLKNKIAQFNRMQDTYQVEMKVYGDGTYTYNDISGMSWSEEGMQAMTLELVGGKGPDLIEYNKNFPVYAEKGMLEDLSEYLEKSEVLFKEDYLENVLGMFTFQNRLVVLPTYFCLQTVYGYTDQVGEERGLSLEQFLKLAGKNEEIPPFDTSTSFSTLVKLCRGIEMTFIDMDNKICHFDSEEFKNLLEFTRKSPVVVRQGDGWYDDPKLGSDYLLCCGSIGTLGDVIQLQYSKRLVTLIGYPTESGDGTYIYAYGNRGSVGISSNSQHKEGAWAFLEYLYSTMYDIDKDSMPGFPAKVSCLKEILNEEIGTTQEVDGEEYIITEENIGYTMGLIQNATPNGINLYANTISDIIYEEAPAYLEGDKSVEEVADIIQNRVQLFLDEQF